MRIIWKHLTLILLLSILVFVSSCTFSQDNSELTNQYNALVQKYNSLVQQNNDLTQQYNTALEKYQSELNTALEKYQNELNTALEKYQNELNTALEGAIVPPYITMNGRKANFSYRNLDNKIECWSWDVEVLESNTINGTFMRNLPISGMNYLGLSTLSQKFINGSKYVNLGGKFTCIDCRPYILKDNFLNVASNIYSRYTDDENRIKEVWNMVTQLCSYVGELKETPRLPLETLLFGGGDCEDVAILTASILKAMSASWNVQLVYMDSDNPTSCKNINHVAVFVDTGTYQTFIESTEKEIMNPYQSVDGFYVDVP